MSNGPCLLLRHDKAGDALKSLAPLRALRQALPETPLHVLVSTHNASLFEYEPGFHVHSLPSHWEQLKPEVLQAHLAHAGMPQAFSRVVNLLCDVFESSDRLLSLFPSTERYSTGVRNPALDVHRLKLPHGTPAGRDESVNIAHLLSQAFGVDLVTQLVGRSAAPILVASDHREAQALMGEKAGIWLGFCPFAGGRDRSHPLQSWESFIPQATRAPWVERFFLFGAPSDCSALERLRERCYHPERVQLCFPSSFRTLGAYLERLDGVIAVDSGPLHLARALGIPTLGFLSGGDAKRWFASLRPGDRLLRRGLFQRFPSAWEMIWAFRRWARPSLGFAT